MNLSEAFRVILPGTMRIRKRQAGRVNGGTSSQLGS